MSRLTELIAGGVVLTDGATGTMLQRAGLPVGSNPSLLCITHPDQIERLHASYYAAGSRIVMANTFSAGALKLAKTGHTTGEVIAAAVGCAKRAAAPYDGLVGLDIGPLGELVEPLGTLPFSRAVELFAEQMKAGETAGADLIAIETMMDVYETKAAVLAAKESTSLPVMATMTFEQDGRTFTGCDIPTMALTLQSAGADIIGINCSVGPRQLEGMIAELRRWTTLPIAAKPNAGLPDAAGGYDLTVAEFVEAAVRLVERGAAVVGGCCGTTPEHIAALARAVEGKTPAPAPKRVPCAVCSSTGWVALDGPVAVGERLNPTGKKRLRQALLDGDMGYLLAQASAQYAQGAQILDVNVGVPGIDEPSVMEKVVRAVQSVCPLPVQIDSANADAIEAGLRAANGRAIVNSVNGKDEVLERLLPVVKKYGAAVIGLTLDENGIPETAQGRVKIAQKILRRAAAYGIPRDDVIIDCLTMTVGAGQKNAAVTLEAVRSMAQLGVKTALGVSNVSFGLPRRDLLNRTFFALALEAGLCLAIVNPGEEGMMDTLSAFRLLKGEDENGAAYLARYSGDAGRPAESNCSEPDIGRAVHAGLCEEAAAAARLLLGQVEPQALISQTLIPVLDEVGRRYENNEIYLPQLVRAAAAAKAAFDVVRARIAAEKTEAVERGCVVLATVQGDIHDIGKNIVRAVLENYGYRIVDLGRDVPPDEVARAVASSGAGLCGLSALMTTTLPVMRDTIALLKERCPGCRAVVGGAVLTADYARTIGADFYAKDASATVAAAREVFG